MTNSPLLTFTPAGIFCEKANIYLDPWQPVDYALITHAHSDHARWGSKRYLAHADSESILRLRLGENISLQTVLYGEKITINGVHFSLHPAGHVIGSAQIRVEYKDEVWVASGDYKTEDDNFCAPFEAVKCHAFITESTFGLPIYKWKPQREIFSDVDVWRNQNQLANKSSILMGYALGKMQRILKNLPPMDQPMYAHGAIFNLNEKLRDAGHDLPHIPLITKDLDKKLFRDALILAPPSALHSAWLKKFEPYSTGYCSGWMGVRAAKNRRSVDRGFVLSDHADWRGLNEVVAATQAEHVFVTHGYTEVFARWLNERGIEATVVKTAYGDEEETDIASG